MSALADRLIGESPRPGFRPQLRHDPKTGKGFDRVAAGVKFGPGAEEALAAALEPAVRQLMRSGKLTSHIYGVEYAGELARKMSRILISSGELD